MDKDILEILIKDVHLLHAGKPGEKVDIVTTLTWHFPRENVSALTVVLPIEAVKTPYSKLYDSESIINRILFKEERRGNSYFSVEVSRIDDPGIFGEIMAEILGWTVKQVANPYTGVGLNTILQRFNMKSEKIVTIASGKIELDGNFTLGELNVPLVAKERLQITNIESDFGFNDLDMAEEEGEWLEKDEPNGNVLLSVSPL